MNVEITSDLKEILVKIDQKLDKLTEDNAETKVALAEIKGEVKAFQEETKGNFKVLEQKINGLDTRISNQEFTNRGILIALVVAILAGAAKLFGIGVN